MKKVITLVAVTLMAATTFGQHEVGAKAGYNYLMTNYEGSETELETDGGGYHLGAYYSYTPMDNLFLGGEVLISSRRWNAISSSSTASSITTTQENYSFYSNHYLDIPLSIKYGLDMRKGRYGDSKYLLFYAGPSVHLLMGTKGSVQRTTRVDAHNQTTVLQNEEEYNTDDLREYFRPVQLGFNAGVSYRFGFGLTVDARYQAFAMPSNKTDLDDLANSEWDGVLKQGMFMFSVGYSFVRD
ncbi:MAG: PorT family protein [Flavobacteriales bacterium]|nr:PorT family protein [Flavobacteriales bacterium]